MNISLTKFSNTKILIFGDVMLDRYWHGDTSRISPEAPVPVVHVKNIEERPGGASNVALNVSALGGQVTLCGLVGNDEAAKVLQTILENAGVNCCFQSIPKLPTINKLRVLAQNQQLMRLDFEDNFIGTNTDDLVAAYTAKLAERKPML